ncbi:MAG: 5-deoxy-glucuronate isomerase [Anaerolineales bacterium]|nr:5-deoxy-glucuronate isomerase [Anaerolineales bacterium]
MSPTPSSLLITPDFSQPAYIEITPRSAQWEHLSFAARQLNRGKTWDFETQENELALVVLGGVCEITSNVGKWTDVGRRPNVFNGMPYTLYLPPRTRFTVEAKSEQLDIAYGWCAAEAAHPARLVKPPEVEIEIRGGDNVTRQINKMIPPGFPSSRLVVVEVYTPSGNWSSYPPHKHDEHIVDSSGNIVEADLEEIYFYKIDRPEGFAYQRIYTRDRKVDEVLLARDSHVVLSPYGYHPVVAAPGYNCYYLNMLAGSAQTLAATDDPDYAWVKQTWKEKDPRLPLVTLEMEKERSSE